MKLVTLLARELKVWPKEATQIAQDRDKCAHPYSSVDDFHGGEWRGAIKGASYGVRMTELATDHATAIVTRADWEAEVARLSAVKPEWIRHRGGKCPVEAGVLVDIRLRNGNVSRNRKPESLMWGNRVKCDSDIMAYRICEPGPKTYTLEWEEREPNQSPRERIKELHALAMAVGMGVSVENPFQWRDRIREIDITVEALEEERAGLVQQLEDEGFRLIGKAVEVADTVVDMSDWRNWHAGDLVECILNTFSRGISVGCMYSLVHVSESSIGFLDDDGDYRDRGDIDKFRWHSRPSA